MASIESTQRIEPARLEEPGEAIGNVVAELSAATATLGKALHPPTAANLAGVVRIMNAYYTNLIEGRSFWKASISPAQRNGELKACRVSLG